MLNLTERMWEISRIDNEIDALRKAGRSGFDAEIARLKSDRAYHVKAIRSYQPAGATY